MVQWASQGFVKVHEKLGTDVRRIIRQRHGAYISSGLRNPGPLARCPRTLSVLIFTTGKKKKKRNTSKKKFIYCVWL